MLSTSIPIYYHTITTLNQVRMESHFLKQCYVHSLFPKLVQLIHYVEPTTRFEGAEFEIVLSRLSAIPSDSPTHNFKIWILHDEHATVSWTPSLRQVIADIIGSGKTIHFVSLDGTTNYHIFNATHRRFSPFTNNSKVPFLEDLIRELCFEIIQFTAYRMPSENEAVNYQKDIKNAQAYFISTQHFDQPFAQRVVTGAKEMHFSTSHGVRQIVDFELYLRAYDQTSWILILLFGIVLIPGSLLLMILLDRAHGTVSVGGTFWRLVRLTYATVLEAGPQTPAVVTKMLLAPKFRYRFLIGLWSLMAIILTNGYKGLVVSDLTAPQPLVGTYSKFEDLHGFLLITYNGDDILKLFNALQKSAKQGKHEKLQSQICSGNFTSFYYDREMQCVRLPDQYTPEIGNVFLQDKNPFECFRSATPEMFRLSRHVNTYFTHSNHTTGRSVQLLKWKNSCIGPTGSLPSEFYVLEIPFQDGPASFNLFNLANFARRGQRAHEAKRIEFEDYIKLAKVFRKSGVVDNTDWVNSFNAFARTLKFSKSESKSLNFIGGQGGIFQNYVGYGLPPGQYSNELYDRLQLLVATGIHHIWEKWFRIWHPTFASETVVSYIKMKACHDDTPKALYLDGNVVTAFYVYATCLIPVALTLIFENHAYALKLCSTFIVFIFKLSGKIAKLCQRMRQFTLRWP